MYKIIVQGKRILRKLLLIAAGIIVCLWGRPMTTAAIYDSPYVTFSPDRQAWTSCAHDKSNRHYGRGTAISTGVTSSLGNLETGQHYYSYVRTGRVPVSKWVVEWPDARCIHNNYTSSASFHGVPFGKQICYREYNSGWIGYCADCYQSVGRLFVYMTDLAAKTIGYVEVGNGQAYYFCCPHCNNLEQGSYWGAHICRQISWNQYQVRYDANAPAGCSGYMAPSYHMYNNAKSYEGTAVDCAARLSVNQYKCSGFEFCGWNTKADGTGTAYEDGGEILNLTTYDYLRDGSQGIVTLYAQWRKEEIKWTVSTEKLQISPGENVYYAAEKGLYYVRADGKTPFALNCRAFIEAAAPVKYQPNYIILETFSQGKSGQSLLYVPTGEQRERYFSESGTVLWKRNEEAVIRRKEQGRAVETVQMFLLAKERSGSRIKILPIGGAEGETETVYSDYQKDQQNSITLVADGEAPELRGLESLKSLQVIDRDAGTVCVNVSAADSLSGIAEFYVKVTNQDNHQEKFFRPETDGNILLTITGDEALFAGDFSVAAYTRDRVGNETQVSCDTTEFALSAKLERILAPHDPIFKKGESGILYITVTGYADRVEVEFPEEMTRLDPELNRTFLYAGNPEYQKEEQVQFMIPLDAAEGADYTITVRAYKGDRRLEEFPELAVLEVNGSILDDIRTRLR